MPDGDYRRQFRAGERLDIPAAAANAWQRAAVLADPLRSLQRQPVVAADGPESIIHIRNDSGADLDRFGVLGVSGILIGPADNLPEFQANYALTGVTPAAGHIGKFAVAFEPIPKGAVGRARVSGTTPVRIAAADVGAAYLDVAVGDPTRLAAGGSGAQVLWSGPGTASGSGSGSTAYWALIRFGGGSSLPQLQYQYMFYGAVSQNQMGGMFIPATAMTQSGGGT